MRWVGRLNRSFGTPFLLLIATVYWTQGFRSLPWMSISYLLKDHLKLSPSASQFMISIAFMPWSVKPIYGIFSDCIPINGSRRVSYLIISGILSFIPWLLLGLFEPIRMSSLYLTVLLTAQNLGAAMADVVIDAMIAEAARKERAEYAGDLQSLSWFAMALGGMSGSVAGGYALYAVDVKGIFLFFSLFPLLQLVASGMVDESDLTGGATETESKDAEGEIIESKFGSDPNNSERVEGESQGCEESNKDEKIKIMGNDSRKSSGGMEEDTSLDDAYTRDLIDDDGDWVEIDAKNVGVSKDKELNSLHKNIKGGDTLLKSSDQKEQFHQDGLRKRKGGQDTIDRESEYKDDGKSSTHDRSLLRKVSGTFGTLFQTIRQPAILQPMLWFFLAQICIPSLSTIMFYYQTDFLHLDASFLGTSRLVGWGALMLGTFIYNRYLKHVKLRKIFWWTHIALACVTFSDIILVTGLNTWLHIPSKAFVIGASVLGDAINQFKFMPFLVVSGRLCQPGIEGTLFALFMSLNNFGTTLSSFFGAALASALDISSGKFDNFGAGICIQSLCTLIPIFFLHLIPTEATGVSSQ